MKKETPNENSAQDTWHTQNMVQIQTQERHTLINLLKNEAYMNALERLKQAQIHNRKFIS